jgi:hypothetical protein
MPEKSGMDLGLCAIGAAMVGGGVCPNAGAVTVAAKSITK